MEDDNSAGRVTQRLRALVSAAAPGDRLPSVRALIAQHLVSPVTVQRAVARLVSEGLIEARPGRGTFVASRGDTAAPSQDFGWQSMVLGTGRGSADALGELIALPPAGAIALSAGYLPPDLQAVPQLVAAAGRAVRRPGVWDRNPVEGNEALRAWFARQLDGGQPHDVIICPGSQAAISAIFRALATPDAPLLVESPTYIGAMTAARAAGLRPVPVPTDARGVPPTLLAEAFARTGARVFYSQPTYANPSGIVLAPERRRAVLDVVAAAGGFLVEDDWARDFDLDGTAPPPLVTADRNGHVIYVRSLTKPAAPGLRVAAIYARGGAFARLKATRTIDDFFVAGALQEIALQLVTSPAWQRHLRTMRATLRERRAALAAAVHADLGAASLPHIPSGGLHLWVRLPDKFDDLELASAAAQRKVIVSPGRHWFPAEPPGSFLRLTFTAPVDVLRRGIAILAEIMKRA